MGDPPADPFKNTETEPFSVIISHSMPNPERRVGDPAVLMPGVVWPGGGNDAFEYQVLGAENVVGFVCIAVQIRSSALPGEFVPQNTLIFPDPSRTAQGKNALDPPGTV